jgi:hypothetical protein
MRHVGLAFWLLRVVLPAAVARWSGRIRQALWWRVSAQPIRHDGVEHPVALLMQAAARANATSIILVLLILMLVLRTSSR